ncbi:MAG: hydroxyacylglutathione hydrolase [Alphaproteobacteria bacterium]|nr:hydroxyacylglutathione hydrolase [Alphaproteobacteria bacterium]MBV9694843.1 hydroxyacylglutathione hydrolase [Alphaproteobacteria bacterium]
MRPLDIAIVPCLSDNYAYLVHDADAGLCAVIDPSEAPPVDKALAARGWKLTHILNTHHHFDHTGGNLPLKQTTGARVVGPAKDRARIPGIDEGVEEGKDWRFGRRAVRVLEIPAHTRAHIAFVFDDAAFTGDTLFAMGCGRLFEGTPEMMWASLTKLMNLPDATRVFCGHEYTQSNGRFALTLEPDNAALASRMKEVDAARAKGIPTVPSTMALEKQTNPFLRPNSAELRRSLGLESASDVEVFAETRRRKDNF